MEVLKHYFGITHNNELIARGIKIRRHDVPNFITQFQTELLCTLFDCKDIGEVMSKGYENAHLIVTKTIDRIMTGEIQLRDLVISKSLHSPYAYMDLQVQASPTHQHLRMLETTLSYLLLTEM
jgi:DNA polymerase elongation subunit (family B)